MDEAEALAKSPGGAMVAPAGCGKTHTIATAVAKYGNGRELVLTHTHAGVEAIRARLADFGITTRADGIDTIAGWALRLAKAFPMTSALPTAEPRNNAEYSAVYSAATRLLGLRPIQEIIRSSYSGIYVDEYQDCAILQHGLAVALQRILPCRVVGDPLQSIFDFGDNEPIRWDEHVRSSFVDIPGPTTPWRWVDSNPKLGEWLKEVREILLAGQGIDLRAAPVCWIDGGDPKLKQRNQLATCFKAARNDDETVIAIQQWPNQCHDLASHLSGLYSCVEPIDTKDLYEFAHRLESSTGFARAIAVLDFSGKCMTKVKSELKSIRQAFSENRVPKVKKHPATLQALLAVASDDSMATVGLALQAIIDSTGAIVYRRELLREMVRAVRVVNGGGSESLSDAAWIVRNRARRRGRVMPRCAVGTTLLVKGLQFHHAILLDADNYDARNLYVALTRASKSLTIVSKTKVLHPALKVPSATAAASA